MSRELSRRCGHVIETFTGRVVDLLNPDPHSICIRDVAHALSQLCRFTGHCSSFYSVAEHSLAASTVPLEDDPDLPRSPLEKAEAAMAALLHDAQEAYLGDVSSPLKSLLNEYQVLEARMTVAVRMALSPEGMDWSQYEDHIKRADVGCLAFEANQLIPSRGSWWGLQLALPEIGLPNPYPCHVWEGRFLDRYQDLKKDIAILRPRKP